MSAVSCGLLHSFIHNEVENYYASDRELALVPRQIILTQKLNTTLEQLLA